MRIGILSDTHGLLRPEVLPALKGVDRILHLGDVGKISILKELKPSPPSPPSAATSIAKAPAANSPKLK